MKLSSMLRKEPVLEEWNETEDRLSRPKVVWEIMRCVRTGFLGCGK